MADSVDYQKKTAELLEELVKWTKFSSLPHVREVLLSTLNTDEKKLAYYYSDGRNSREVAGIAGADRSSLQDWWKKWIKSGLAEPIKVQRGERAKRSFSLEDFGIEIPAPKLKPANIEPEDNQDEENPIEEKKNE